MEETLASSALHPGPCPFPLTHPGIEPGLAQTINCMDWPGAVTSVLHSFTGT